MKNKKENQKKKRHIGLKVTLSVILLLGATYGTFGIINGSTTTSLIKYAKSFDKVVYENQLQPQIENDNQYFFKTSGDFKIMQLTDIHLGSGYMSVDEDKKAMNAIAAMISYEKPDLVVLTGDLAFPVPYIAGTFNNRHPVKLIMNLMETLGVYYTIVFGNHDTELYSYASRKEISKMYEDDSFHYCLFTDNYADEIYGNGNQIINIYREDDIINKTLYFIDSNAYLKNDPLGIKWLYDNVHEDQIEWYSKNVEKYQSYNKSVLENSEETLEDMSNFTTTQSFLFQHIPLAEYLDAYQDYITHDNQNTVDTQLNFGIMGESVESKMVYSPIYEDDFFETMLSLNSTKAMFCGHDHLNNFSFKYKGIDLTYGMSIDYLAYDGIDLYGSQRGCTLIEMNHDGSYTLHQENYYQEKYVTKYEKETISMEDYYQYS